MDMTSVTHWTVLKRQLQLIWQKTERNQLKCSQIQQIK